MEAQPLRGGDAEPAPRPARYHATSDDQKDPASSENNTAGGKNGNIESSSGGVSKNVLDETAWECNICLEPLKDTVCTMCGHLYCWPCLYRWLNTGHTTCPVCKAGVTKDNVIPVYVRGNDTDPRTRDTPSRPSSQRPVPERPVQEGGIPGMTQGQVGGVTFSAGVGFFPSLLGLQFQAFTTRGQGATENRPLTDEELTQLNTSRFLMVLGYLVVICLIFF